MGRCSRTITFDEFMRYATRYGARDPHLALAIAVRESFDAGWSLSNRLLCADQRGPVDECGVMQIRPSTARQIVGYDVSCEELMEPAHNIAIGVRYLNYLLDTFGGDVKRAVAAYNAGPGAVRSGIPNPGYVSAVMGYYSRLTGRHADSVDRVASIAERAMPWMIGAAVGALVLAGIVTIMRSQHGVIEEGVQ